MDAKGFTYCVTVIKIVFDVAVVLVAHSIFDVSTQENASVLLIAEVEYDEEVAPEILLPFFFHW